MLLVASYFFYGYWDVRYLVLLFVSSVIDYIASIGIENSSDNLKRKKLYLTLSVCSNLGILGFFKYYNFFVVSAKDALGGLGFSVNPVLLNYALPLGISFYTFQTMSYTIDVYRGELKPVRNFFDFALFVSFFPQLVAGPIERATRLLPQVLSERKISYDELQKGAFLCLLGFFKKVFVADNLSFIVDPIFSNKSATGFEVFIACWAFFFQIYGDFSGYSDIARGLSKFMGFELMRNFNLPMFSSNIVDLWKRWHISFMTWLRDYLYYSLGGSKVSVFRQHANNIITFFVSGLWHGASWHFVLWGLYGGILTSLYRIMQPYIPKLGGDNIRFIKNGKLIIKIFFTVGLFAISAVFFRASEVSVSFLLLKKLFFEFGLIDPILFEKVLKIIFLLVLIEIHQYRTNDEFSIFKLSTGVRTIAYLAMFYSILILGNFNKNEFIYFVF